MYRLLVVDDEPIVAEGITRGIDWTQYNVEILPCAYNGAQALNLCKTWMPDIIITDIKMPGMDGLALIAQAQSVVPHARFIIISAFEVFSYAQTAIDLNVSAYLVKPVRSEAVIRAVRQAVLSIETDRNHPKFQSESSQDVVGYDMVDQAKRYIDAHLHQDITLNEVAAHVNLSPSYFSRQFKKAVEASFVDYVRRAKTERAKILLVTTNKKVYEIAQELGYLSDRYFTEVFKSTTGMTPQAYRNRKQKSRGQ